MTIKLADDGTMDTMLRCSECGEEFRFNFQTSETEEDYDTFVQSCIEETEAKHECPHQTEQDLDYAEPEEDDITTEDGRTFYQSGKKVVQPNAYTHGGADTESFCYLMPGWGHYVGCYPTAEAALRTFMDKAKYWPNVWTVSDHGNVSLYQWTEKE